MASHSRGGTRSPERLQENGCQVQHEGAARVSRRLNVTIFAKSPAHRAHPAVTFRSKWNVPMRSDRTPRCDATFSRCGCAFRFRRSRVSVRSFRCSLSCLDSRFTSRCDLFPQPIASKHVVRPKLHVPRCHTYGSDAVTFMNRNSCG